MNDKEKKSCDNCIHKGVCFERANIEEIDGKESEAMKSWEEYVKQYGCQYYQPKLPEDSVVLTKAKYREFLEMKRDMINNAQYKRGSKETAIDILKEIATIKLDHIDVGEMLLSFKITAKIQELAKKFGVEVEE